METIQIQDYSLVGRSAKKAVDRGLAEADWYTSPISREEMRTLLVRKDWPALRDSVVWFGLLIAFGYWGFQAWGSYWAIVPFLCYGVLYASSSDSRWHESSHGTAFKTDWLNEILYEIASFMVLRESTPWRWSHTRHHSDTIIVGRDPEIAVPRPPNIKSLIFSFFNLSAFPKYFHHLVIHSLGKISEEEKTYIPESDYTLTFWKARIYLAIYLISISLSLYYWTILPLMYVGLPNLYGAWLMPLYGYTQHAGLAENVLDHRLNCRTVYMNSINRFLYWNMNYHLEHHMFPLVPYHQLPRLHQLIKEDTPVPYPSLFAAYKEIIPAVLKQIKDPKYYVKRQLPISSKKKGLDEGVFTFTGAISADGWVDVCDVGMLGQEEVIRFDHGTRTFAVYMTKVGGYYATDGICTHGNTHLADGLVKGKLVECPKHNGRFDVTNGEPVRKPVCQALKTYPVKVEEGKIKVDLSSLEKLSNTRMSFTVMGSKSVSSFIRELILAPDQANFKYRPGDYLKLVIPAYKKLTRDDFLIDPIYEEEWKPFLSQGVRSENLKETSRNYSLSTNPEKDEFIAFNIRIALAPLGKDVPAGVGSSYVYSLKPGDKVEAEGPYGDFRIKKTDKEMVYLGGGAGMAPLRSHISYLLETEKSKRKISFWYGARNTKELFYRDYFEGLEREHENFSYHLAFSDPQDASDQPAGFIHELLLKHYLSEHRDVTSIEFYLCGPPLMLQAAMKMLHQLGVGEDQISFDDFS